MLPKAVRLLRRAEFVQASRVARAVATPYFIVQSVPDAAPDLSRRARKTPQHTTQSMSQRIKLGITASRKVGNAVARNRAKRRLRALLHQTFLEPPVTSAPSRRIVLVARKGCLDADFSAMHQQLQQALKRSKAKTS